ncbi:MAG: ATP-binding protein [Coriobacteriia bacterium]|nr:ATP-binding protein [Coriobacteriia bacterium]
MIKREITNNLQKMTEYYPVVSLTGPRQSGKSTLVKEAFPGYEYFNLEEKSLYFEALNNPEGFINNIKGKAIIDEAQLVPDLFSAIQVAVDKKQENGNFILSGSQNFLLSENITQSLAGRVGICELLPLNYYELYNSEYKTNINQFILHGGYPRLYVNKTPMSIHYRNYLRSYVKRDVEGYLRVRNSMDYERLISLLASNVGQLLNYKRLSNDLGVEINTVKSWISLLISSYIVYIVPSYSTNIRKRVIRTPKIYFYDTGLLCHLMRIHDETTLLHDEKYGLIFENFIMTEMVKSYFNSLQDHYLYFYRDSHGNEIDIVDITNPRNVVVAEVKSGMTMMNKYNKVLYKAEEELNIKQLKKQIIYNGDRNFDFDGTKVISAESFLLSNMNNLEKSLDMFSDDFLTEGRGLQGSQTREL